MRQSRNWSTALRRGSDRNGKISHVGPDNATTSLGIPRIPPGTCTTILQVFYFRPTATTSSDVYCVGGVYYGPVQSVPPWREGSLGPEYRHPRGLHTGPIGTRLATRDDGLG